jgi:hypothetical protein
MSGDSDLPPRHQDTEAEQAHYTLCLCASVVHKSEPHRVCFLPGKSLFPLIQPFQGLHGMCKRVALFNQ